MRAAPGVDTHTFFISSEGAEYVARSCHGMTLQDNLHIPKQAFQKKNHKSLAYSQTIFYLCRI